MKKTKKMTIVEPAVSPDEALKSWQNYQELKKKIIDPNDVQRVGPNEFLKKSYWRKIATFFNLSVEKVDEKKEQIGKTLVWHFTCKAIAPNGRSAIGTGSCDVYEKAKLTETGYVNGQGGKAKPNSLHNVRSTAETRAFNRAVSNLVGGGEVSAEEINNEITYEAPSPTPTYQKKPIAKINYKCSKCAKSISKAENEYSLKFYAKQLCRACQASLKASQDDNVSRRAKEKQEINDAIAKSVRDNNKAKQEEEEINFDDIPF